MVSFFVAILISGAVGFVAGQFFNVETGVQPISPKEAMTGDVDLPSPQPNLPNKTSTAPVMCQAGKSLQEQLLQLKYFELQRICAEASLEWHRKNVEAYAPESSERDTQELVQEIKNSLRSTAYWKGQTSITKGNQTVQVEIILSFFDDKKQAEHRSNSVDIKSLADFCFDISPYFTVNGKVQPTGSMGGCGQGFRKKEDQYYLSWPTNADAEIAPIFGAILVPMPSPRPAALEYLDSESGQWTTVTDFHWQASSYEESVDVRERYFKKLEESPR